MKVIYATEWKLFSIDHLIILASFNTYKRLGLESKNKFKHNLRGNASLPLKQINKLRTNLNTTFDPDWFFFTFFVFFHLPILFGKKFIHKEYEYRTPEYQIHAIVSWLVSGNLEITCNLRSSYYWINPTLATVT